MQFDADSTNDFHHFDPANVADDASAGQIVSLADAVPLLEEMIQSGTEDPRDPVVQFAQLLWQLAQQIENADLDQIDLEMLEEISAAVIEGANWIRSAFSGQPDAIDHITELHEHIVARFGSDLEILTSDLEDQAWTGELESTTESPISIDELNLPSTAEIESLLSALRSDQDTNKDAAPAPSGKPPQPTADAVQMPTTAKPPSADDDDEIDNIDGELRDAFMDDAMRCLASMENALLVLESNPTDGSPLSTLGRELHTLKGASASIGLSRLADYIHKVEDAIGEIEQSGQTAPLDTLLTYVDTIRERVSRFKNPDPSPTENTDNPATAKTASGNGVGDGPLNFDDSSADDETVRVKASRLNRLMDMLSELLMSRNRRDSELSRLIQIHEELLDNVSRLRALNQETDTLPALDRKSAASDSLIGAGPEVLLSNIANDVLETAQILRECYQSIADGNNHVSQFIHGFRQELVELRRTPVSGLFNRLRRAVSDAARAEDKQVQLKLVGQDTGIERAIQTRLFEPLLHIVRNSVSHGIETPGQRTTNGKSEQGTITFQAKSGPDLLVIEVCDDGKGLDYDAIRRRGLDRGLISPDTTSEKELAQLIFHPCFSTRETASQISGRGVGMDVVATTLERMRGWVEVDSVAAQGTTIRLSIPLPSMIQHVMVFRSGGQLFAVPMQAVQSAGDHDDQIQAVSLTQLLELGAPAVNETEMVVLGSQLAGEADQTQTAVSAILVDEIIGPEEVVIRPMPKLFRDHPVCSGATVSGLGEVVLLLDANRLSQSAGTVEVKTPVEQLVPTSKKRVLVVDDSAAARMRVVQSLSRYPVQIVQSSNGQDALQTFQSASFDVVFSDIEMPKMTGLQLLAEIKKDANHQETPVVLVSSRTEDVIRREAIRLGATACLEKPLTPAAMDSVWPKISHTLTHNS